MKRKTFACRFKLRGGWCTCIQVSGNNMTKEEATAHARRIAKKRTDVVCIDSVYEVKE